MKLDLKFEGAGVWHLLPPSINRFLVFENLLCHSPSPLIFSLPCHHFSLLCSALLCSLSGSIMAANDFNMAAGEINDIDMDAAPRAGNDFNRAAGEINDTDMDAVPRWTPTPKEVADSLDDFAKFSPIDIVQSLMTLEDAEEYMSNVYAEFDEDLKDGLTLPSYLRDLIGQVDSFHLKVLKLESHLEKDVSTFHKKFYSVYPRATLRARARLAKK